MANLDFAATQQLKEILPDLKKQGKALPLSEHRFYYLTDIADEFWGMSDGEIDVYKRQPFSFGRGVLLI